MKIRKILIGIVTSAFLQALFAIAGGVCAGMLAYSLLHLKAESALLGLVALVVFVFASIPLGMMYARKFFSESSSNTAVFLIATVVTACTGVALIALIGARGQNFLFAAIFWMCGLLIINVLAGISIELKESLVARQSKASLWQTINIAAFILSSVLTGGLFLLVSYYLIRMTNTPVQAAINTFVLMLTAFLFVIPFILVLRPKPVIVYHQYLRPTGIMK